MYADEVRRRRRGRPLCGRRDGDADGPRGDTGAAARPRPPRPRHALHPRADAGRRVPAGALGSARRVVAAGTPPVTGATFHYGDERGRPAHAPLYAPRRTVLDAVLLDAAAAAGAQVRLGVDVTGLRRDGSGRVTGVQVRARGDDPVVVPAGLTVGADGLRSTVAPPVGAGRPGRAPRRPASSTATGRPRRPRTTAGSTGPAARPGSSRPTTGRSASGRRCRPPGSPRAAPAETFAAVLHAVAPEAARTVAASDRDGPLRGFPGMPGRLRQAAGAGWALVGDAGSFKDPLTAHGITDALRDAELLARAAVDGSPAAFDGYERTRDALAVPLLEVAERIVGFGWDTPEIRALLRAESAVMRPEVEVLRALDRPESGERAA